MSAEPRRIRKLVRQSGNPPLNKSERQAVFQKVADEVNAELRRGKQKALTYALSKVRIIEGYVTLPQLAAERGIQAQLARLWVKAAGIPKPRDRWVWAEGSKALKRARKALGLSNG